MFAFFGFLLILIPTILILIFYLIFKRKIFLKIIVVLWISIILLFISGSIFNSKKEIQTKDIYGEYVIDRNKFSGKNADWQYNHYKFEIKNNHEFIFYRLNDHGKVVNQNKGKIEIIEGFASPRIRIIELVNEDRLIEEEPTLYREIWNFYYVFKTEKFGNMFFKKGKWKYLD